MRRTGTLVLFLMMMVTGILQAQTDSAGYVKYSPGFRFKEGLYLNYEQFKTNSPVPKKYIVSKFDRNDFEFFTNILSQPTIEYYDQYGLLKEIPVTELWGFCRRGSVYINYGDDFCRIPVIGNICHFVATIIVYDDRYYNPMYSYSYTMAPTTTSHSEVHQYIMHFNTGKILDYSVENVEVLLKDDEALYNEFMALKPKKKRDMKFLYIRKFNEKYPLYIPTK